MHKLLPYLMLCLAPISSIMAQEILNMELVSHTELGSIGNDIWGYVDSTGREYAIAGSRANTQIYDISDPAQPRLVFTVPGLRSSIWRDYKSYGNHIYGVADQGTEGVTIIDMTHAPDSISYTRWTDTLAISGVDEVINTCHNVYLDDRGRLYLAGCNIGNQGVLIYDVTQTPSTPQLLGVQDERYSHDVINYGDTMYSSEVYEGNLAVYDMSDMSNIKLLAREQTSSTFTHNAWPSDDGRYIYTTDETGNGNLDAYDITDLDNIQRLDTYRPKDNPAVLPHNAHYLDGHLITSWYIEGIVIVDGSRPHNLIRVAQYDTNPQDRNGCWGAYPYLPSGLILATDMDNGLYILRSSHKKAAYVEGTVTDAETGRAINNASISLMADKITSKENTDAQGQFATGAPYTGEALLSISLPGYDTYTSSISMVEGEVTMIDARLTASERYVLSGAVMDDQGQPISDVQIIAVSEAINYETSTDASGRYQIEATSDDYMVYFAKWGYEQQALDVTLDQAQSQSITMSSGYEDDFFADLGWMVEHSATAGRWTRDIPNGTRLGSSLSNPDQDIASDIGRHCYVTGNGPGSVGSDDVDDGSTTLISPSIDLSSYDRPEISLYYWFFSGGGSGASNDQMTIELISADGAKTPLKTITDPTNGWRVYTFYPSDSTDARSVQIAITVADDSPGHIVEGGIDAFSIAEKGSTTSTTDPTAEDISVSIYPNPTSGILQVVLARQADLSTLHLYSVSGQLLMKSTTPEMDISALSDGLYILEVHTNDGQKISKEIIKSK